MDSASLRPPSTWALASSASLDCLQNAISSRSFSWPASAFIAWAAASSRWRARDRSATSARWRALAVKASAAAAAACAEMAANSAAAKLAAVCELHRVSDKARSSALFLASKAASSRSRVAAAAVSNSAKSLVASAATSSAWDFFKRVSWSVPSNVAMRSSAFSSCSSDSSARISTSHKRFCAVARCCSVSARVTFALAV
mmetsp:Transcript_33125/g.53320  ORF Transcript_33125/g.53320 Transcript_33125/m.53320 type:complete len:200 (+) Transcript_33125:369-968(+)